MKSFEEILDFAIDNEQKAHDLYMDIAEMATRPGMRQTFLEFAAQEMQHRERLEAIKAGKLPELDQARVETLGLSEHLVDVPVEKDMDYQSALLFAMKAEQRAYDLYAGLAKATDDPNLVTLFEGLAQEELKHKLHFEREYDDVVLGDN